MKFKTLLPLLALTLIAPGLGAEDAKPETKPAPGTTKDAAKKDEAGWYTDYAEAQKVAAKSHKPMLVLFTGSDWCGWCIKLEKKTLGEAEFKTWAEKKVVLYKADAKGGPGNLSAENQKMMQGYGARGFPTIVITDAKGKNYGTTGFRDLTPKEYTKHLEEIIATKGRSKSTGK
jgi:thioredoxin-related protein